MTKIVFYFGNIVGFYLIGRLISKINGPFLKKIIRSKKHERATDRMVNNYWGNMMSILGAVIAVGTATGIIDFTFYGATAILIMFAYMNHLSDASGVSILDSFVYMTDWKDSPQKQYLGGTLCICVAVLITGAISPYVAPYILEESKNAGIQVEETDSTSKEYMHETTKEKEQELIDAAKESFQ